MEQAANNGRAPEKKGVLNFVFRTRSLDEIEQESLEVLPGRL